jgi:hypothetical protein
VRPCGCGEEANEAKLAKLTAEPPNADMLKRPVTTGETCVQDVGRFDATRTTQRRYVVQGALDVELRGPMPSVGAAPTGFHKHGLQSLMRSSATKPPSAFKPPSATPSPRRRGVVVDDDSSSERGRSRSPECSSSLQRSTFSSPVRSPSSPQLRGDGVTDDESVGSGEDEGGPSTRPLELGQAKGGGKELKLPGREKPEQNKWLCNERHPYIKAKKGRARHYDANCKRGRWAYDSSIPMNPPQWTEVVIAMTAAAGVYPPPGSAAGKTMTFNGRKWEEVLAAHALP